MAKLDLTALKYSLCKGHDDCGTEDLIQWLRERLSNLTASRDDDEFTILRNQLRGAAHAIEGLTGRSFELREKSHIYYMVCYSDCPDDEDVLITPDALDDIIGVQD